VEEKHKNLEFIKPKWRDVVKNLCKYDSNIYNSLINNSHYEFVIELDDLDKIHHFNDRKVPRYYPLINYLKIFKINMTIRTIRNKNKLGRILKSRSL
jgi:hypothetical protein